MLCFNILERREVGGLVLHSSLRLIVNLETPHWVFTSPNATGLKDFFIVSKENLTWDT